MVTDILFVWLSIKFLCFVRYVRIRKSSYFQMTDRKNQVDKDTILGMALKPFS